MSLPRNHEENEEIEKENSEEFASVLAFYSENSAPVDFQVESSDSEDDENFDQLLSSPVGSAIAFIDKIPCPLCRRRRQRLTCKECLLRGDFCVQNKNYRHTTQVKDKYCELKLKFLKAQQKRDKLNAQCASLTERKEKIAIIIDEIEKCQNTISIQKELKHALRGKIYNANRESEALSRETQEELKMHPVFRSRLDNMQSHYRRDVTKLQKFHSGVQSRQDSLKGGTKSRIIQLRHHVFPIDEMDQKNRSGNSQKGIFDSGSGYVESWSDEEDDTVRSLMAAKSNYWSRPDELVSSFGSCYTVTGSYGPTLPASGDYSAYNMWADRNQNPSGASGGSTNRNPAHCIAAALTYTTQFVNLIAYYLDLRLPHRLSYSEFTNGDLLGGKFSRKVAKLNANVIHLCASQGITPSYLQPRKTVPNLLLLFDPDQSDLGRRGPFEVTSQLAKSMEDSIEKDLVIFEEGSSESDTDWSDSVFPSDWETINRGAISEEFGLQEMTTQSYLNSPTLSYTSDSLYRSRNTSSLAGTGLLSSVTSFFRGWSK